MSSQAYRTARVADASRWRTSSQAYGAFYKLPPRESVKDPQHSLLVALAPAVEGCVCRSRGQWARCARHTATRSCASAEGGGAGSSCSGGFRRACVAFYVKP